MGNALIEERPPTADEVHGALASYVAAVQKHYGKHVLGMVLFGSRARGDNRPDSDADIAIILENGDWRFWTEKRNLADLTYEAMMEFGVRLQPWPISQREWENPAEHHNTRLIEAMKRDGRTLLVTR
jgi:antitoxin ChpS